MKKTSVTFHTILRITLFVVLANSIDQNKAIADKYSADWASLRNHNIPQWLKDGKFGIYTHWGIYCYSGTSGNVTWNSSVAYMEPKNSTWGQEFEKTHGKLTPDFGYKDLIPKFTGENFDANEWAELFAKSGAKFAGPVAEHHDGFAMWDTKWSKWNAAKMGPKRDVVGELEKAIKAKGMKFVTAFHHSANWYFFPVWDKTKDCSNPAYSGLYGPIHKKGAVPTQEFLDEWLGKLVEVVDNYDPDFVWFDFALDIIREDVAKEFVAHYYNTADKRGKEVIISYKHHDLPPGVGLFDLELGQEENLTHHDWITDTTIEDGSTWGYLPDLEYKTVNMLIDNLIDRVSKNGYLLLNVGPKWDGSIPEVAKERLLGMGKWLEINGEAIYGTSTWTKYGESPNKENDDIDEQEQESENEDTDDEEEEDNDPEYTSEDIRFTVKDNVLYAIILDWPKNNTILIKSLVRHAEDIDNEEGKWGYVDLDEDKKDHISGYYLYPDEVKSITMLGDGKELKWQLIPTKGLKVQLPKERPCEHAYTLKIIRKK